MTLIELLIVACPAIGLIAGVAEGFHRGFLWTILGGLIGAILGFCVFLLLICLFMALDFVVNLFPPSVKPESQRLKNAWPPAPKEPAGD